jgi:hypothetical protein
MPFIQSVNLCQVITMKNSPNLKEGKIMNNSKNSQLNILYVWKILDTKIFNNL